jgi:hypothetical protein
MNKKNRYKTRAKKGKTKGDKKNQIKKRRKDNKTLSRKRGREKNLTKGNKRKEPKMKVLTHELLAMEIKPHGVGDNKRFISYMAKLFFSLVQFVPTTCIRWHDSSQQIVVLSNAI